MDPNRVEAERLLGVAEKLLNQRDFLGSKEFAILAQESAPLLDGTDQILAVADVLLAAEKRVNNNQHDWYSILQIERRSDDQDLIKRQYRRLALLLHPDKNKFPHADQAFTLVAEAWAVLADSRKKFPYDNELSLYTRIDLTSSDSVQQGKLPVRRNERSANTNRDYFRENNTNNTNNNTTNSYHGDQRSRLSTFWTACPYCYILFEYPRVYENCCLRCQSCRRGFQAVPLPNLPPLVPGKDSYYCCWGVFPLGFSAVASENGPRPASSLPNWMPPVSSGGNAGGASGGVGGGAAEKVGSGGGNVQGDRGAPRKRGRPRKYPLRS